jgi:hypothetical protein
MNVKVNGGYLFEVNVVMGDQSVGRKFLVIAKSCDEAVDKVRLLNQRETEAGEPLLPIGDSYALYAMHIEFEFDVYDI